MKEPLQKKFIELTIQGVALRIAALHRAGSQTPILFLHGFGSGKEDIADLALRPEFAGRQIIAFDAPGCGESDCSNLSMISIPFLVETAQAVLRHFNVRKFHLIGHSMGGLTALLLADADQTAVQSFTNIKGNLAAEDCFLSRQILEHPSNDPDEFLRQFIERAWASPTFSSPAYAATLPHKVRANAVAPIFRSMVDLSENGELLEKFIALPCTKMFVYGEQYRGLSYLNTLLKQGVQLAEIAHSGHFPMYSNPTALWERLNSFIYQTEMGQHNE